MATTTGRPPADAQPVPPAYPVQPVQPMTPAQELAYKRRWIALILLSLSLVLIVADSTIVNIAFPSIRKTFGASYADAEWVNSIYSLVFGAALITWGKLGDTFGRRRIFILGTITFLIGSAGTGFAPSIGAMILFRAVQGMGGAMISPSTLSIISSTFKGKERGAAFGVWGASAGVAAALGPILGGWLIAHGSGITASLSGFFNAIAISPDPWRLAFLINVPVGLIAIAGSLWAIQEVRDASIKHSIDVLGIVLVSLSLGLAVFGAIEGQNYGWLQAKQVFNLGPISYPQLAAGAALPANTPSFIPFTFVFAIIFFVLFVITERRQETQGGEPLFEFGMLRYTSFRFGLMTILIVALGEFGVVLALSIFFQLAKGLDAFQSGVRFLPFALATIIAAPLAGQFSGRFGAKWVVTTGMVLEAISLFLLSRVLYVDTSYWLILPVFLIYGAGVGLAIAQLANIVLSDIPPQKAGVGSGATNTLRQLGASLGIAIIGAVLFGVFANEAKPLVDQSTAFTDFGTAVAAAPELSAGEKSFGKSIADYGDKAKQAIKDGLDKNEGFDGSNTDVVETAITQVRTVMVDLPIVGKTPATTLLKTQGINVDDPASVAKLKADLKPYSDKLSANLQNALAQGFSTAARTAALVATFFVSMGALSSLFIPNKKQSWGGGGGSGAPAMGH